MAIEVHRRPSYGLAASSDLEAAWAPRILSVTRVAVTLTYLEHAGQSFWSVPPGGSGTPPLLSFLGIGLLIQLLCGGLLLVGLFSRFCAFILSGEMAVAYWVVHAPQAPYPIANKGEPAVLYCFIFLLLFASGPGTWSLDAVWFCKKRS